MPANLDLISDLQDQEGCTNAMTVKETISAAIKHSVQQGFAEQIDFTKQMMRMPSLRGAEGPVQDFVFDALKKRGYAVERFSMDRDAIENHPGGGKFTAEHSQAPIVVGTHRPREEKGRSLILQAHVDVVPAGPEALWTGLPFEPRIDGDWLYGRGGADMKAGHVASIFALDALSRLGHQPAATVFVQSVVEEESTGNGALMTHLRGYKADAVLIPEPEDEKLVRANVGVLWFQIEVRGRPVHVRDMTTGSNAIDAAYRIIAALRTLESDWNDEKANHRHFENEGHPINLNIGKIEGGDWASSVPCWCRLDCRLALYPGMAANDAAAEVRKRVADFSRGDPYLASNPPEISFNGFYAEGYVLEPGSLAESALSTAHSESTGEELGSFVTAGYLDTRIYALYDKIPALCYGPYSKNIHGFDEAVSLQSLQRITTTIALFISKWCMLESKH